MRISAKSTVSPYNVAARLDLHSSKFFHKKASQAAMEAIATLHNSRPDLKTSQSWHALNLIESNATDQLSTSPPPTPTQQTQPTPLLTKSSPSHITLKYLLQNHPNLKLWPSNVKLKHYIEYIFHNRDDSPVGGVILHDREVELGFQRVEGDLVCGMGIGRGRLVVGPQRGGALLGRDQLGGCHVDVCLQGLKRWVLFPPATPLSLAAGYLHDHTTSPIIYFINILPKILSLQKQSCGAIELLQHESETVFVPQGWSFAIVNCRDSLSFTRSVVREDQLEGFWKVARSKWKGRIMRYAVEMKCGRLLEIIERKRESGGRYFSDSQKSQSDPEQSAHKKSSTRSRSRHR